MIEYRRSVFLMDSVLQKRSSVSAMLGCDAETFLF